MLTFTSNYTLILAFDIHFMMLILFSTEAPSSSSYEISADNQAIELHTFSAVAEPSVNDVDDTDIGDGLESYSETRIKQTSKYLPLLQVKPGRFW